MLQAHVDEGLKLARRHRLPRPIADFIPEHQGTLKMGFFLHKARETNPGVDEQRFRYRGPAPRSREAAILMLADGCEAALRSLPQETSRHPGAGHRSPNRDGPPARRTTSGERTESVRNGWSFGPSCRYGAACVIAAFLAIPAPLGFRSGRQQNHSPATPNHRVEARARRQQRGADRRAGVPVPRAGQQWHRRDQVRSSQLGSEVGQTMQTGRTLKDEHVAPTTTAQL